MAGLQPLILESECIRLEPLGMDHLDALCEVGLDESLWTWVAPPWQRSSINTEAKLLMLRHAFNTLQCNRVEWKTDALNTVYYSVLQDEWPTVEQHLIQKLRR